MIQMKIATVRKHLTTIKPILLWLFAAWLGYRLMLNGIRKFDPEGMWTNAFSKWGYPVWFRILIGVLETAGGLMIFIPKIRHFGALILCIVMVGALGTRIVNGTSLDDALSILFYVIAFMYLAAHHDDSSKHSV